MNKDLSYLNNPNEIFIELYKDLIDKIELLSKESEYTHDYFPFLPIESLKDFMIDYKQSIKSWKKNNPLYRLDWKENNFDWNPL